jgi:phage antirepressor YoqD-like protein
MTKVTVKGSTYLIEEWKKKKSANLDVHDDK